MAVAGRRVHVAGFLDGFLFPGPKKNVLVRDLSGGERNRVHLAKTLTQGANLILLVEPTNDLDIQTLAVLEEFLDHFVGCLIVVSHDRYFLDRTVDHIVSFEDGKIGPRYPTPYTTFRRLAQEAKAQEEAQVKVKEEGKVEGGKRRVTERVQKLSWKEQRELEELEAKIETLESQKERLMAEMATIGDDYIKLQTLSEKLEKLEVVLEHSLDRWMELEEMSM